MQRTVLRFHKLSEVNSRKNIHRSKCCTCSRTTHNCRIPLVNENVTLDSRVVFNFCLDLPHLPHILYLDSSIYVQMLRVLHVSDQFHCPTLTQWSPEIVGNRFETYIISEGENVAHYTDRELPRTCPKFLDWCNHLPQEMQMGRSYPAISHS